MAAVIAVFLIALLAVFLRPEGRADRFARAIALVSRGKQTGRNLLCRGTEVVDRLSDDLAADQTQAGSLDDLLGQADSAPVAPTTELAPALRNRLFWLPVIDVSAAERTLMFETRRRGTNGSCP